MSQTYASLTGTEWASRADVPRMLVLSLSLVGLSNNASRKRAAGHALLLVLVVPKVALPVVHTCVSMKS
jgi:hypothetical protein